MVLPLLGAFSGDYVVQEDAISEQIFRVLKSALHDLAWAGDSVFSSIKIDLEHRRMAAVMRGARAGRGGPGRAQGRRRAPAAVEEAAAVPVPAPQVFCRIVKIMVSILPSPDCQQTWIVALVVALLCTKEIKNSGSFILSALIALPGSKLHDRW